jgi:tetratricopeptide (TPR) repeat protein
VANRIPVVPGKYALHVQVISRQAGKIFESQRKIVVSPIKEAALSGPLLAATVRQIAQPDGATPFQYYGVQFIPIVERKFPRGEPLRVLFQIQLPGEASGNYLMDYVIAHAQLREQRLVLKETLPAGEFQNGRLLKAKTIKISDLAEGDYRAVLTLRPEGGNTVLAASNIPFRITDEPANDRLYFLSNFRIAAQGGVAAYVRALESVAQQDREKASEYLAQAIDQNQSNSYAGQMLVGLYFNSRQYARVTALYERMGLSAFRSAPESLAQISVSFWQAGNAAQARQVIQTARTLFPQDPLLDATERSFRHAQSH